MLEAELSSRSFEHDMGLGDLVQKAFYLGVGLASYAGEKAGDRLTEFKTQTQKLVEEMVARGEMTAEEARRVVDEMVNQAQQPPTESSSDSQSSQPRRIEILTDAESHNDPDIVRLRQQVQDLQEQLKHIRKD
jgi:polyhydroxyalkanoate synthesis regulator phasin